jgi:hypothetical protein
MRLTWQQLTGWLLRDKQGHIVLWQAPNLALMIWIVAWALAWPLHGTAHQLVHFAGGVALFIWAVLELFDGVTPFRRLLGLIVLVVMVTWH